VSPLRISFEKDRTSCVLDHQYECHPPIQFEHDSWFALILA